jgi:cytochrome P450
VAPNEISYITASAWGDIYKASRDQVQLAKYMPTVPASYEQALFNRKDDAEHRKIRKILSNVFSDRGIRDREQVLLRHVSHMAEQLVNTLGDAPNRALDLVAWYQNVTTDVIG